MAWTNFRVGDDTPGTAGRNIRAYRVRPCERAAALGLCQAWGSILGAGKNGTQEFGHSWNVPNVPV